MSRAKWKGPYVNSLILKEGGNPQDLEIISRASTILPEFIGKTVKIYNGYRYHQLSIVDAMVGYKFGEFAPTRKKVIFKKSKLKSKLKSRHGAKNKR